VPDPCVHGNFIKPGPSIWRSTAWIKWAERVSGPLIWAIGFGLDGVGTSSSVCSAETERREAPWPAAWVSSSSSYGAWNEVRFLPMWSRLREEFVLWTYRGENGPLEAGDGEVARAVFNGGGDGVRWRSSSKNSSGSNGVGGGSSSKHRIGTGGSSVAARRRQRGSAMAAGVWAKFTRDRALFIGVLVLNRRWQKS
jgi:hypothetical protein